MTYEDALAYLDTYVNYERQHQPHAMRQVRPERMRELCRALGDPQRSFRSILVTGTNGKGSVCAMLYSMLRQSPLRIGLYSSPHLEQLRERIRVWASGPGVPMAYGEDWIAAADVATLVEEMQPVLEGLRRDWREQPPTYFEVLTAIAFLHFHRRRVEVAVVEVGLGGRLDATNVLEQAVSIMTPIEVDHTETLGSDPASIAREKAGIIKPHQCVFTAAQRPEVAEILLAACDAHGVPLYACGQDVTARILQHGVRGLDVSITSLRGIYESLAIPLLGRHQAQNAALAIGALEALSGAGVPLTLVERGLATVEWPGRLEVIHEEPLVLLDGAHNVHAAAALADTLQELWPGRPIHLLIGMSSDKPVEEVGRLLGPLVRSAICTRSYHPRALDPTALAKRLAPYCPDVHVMSDAADAYTYLFNAVTPKDAIVVTGSLFLVGQLRAAIRRSRLHAPRSAQPEAAVPERVATT